MKHAFLIMAYNEPEILNLLLSKLYHENNVCFVYIDSIYNRLLLNIL